MFDLLRLNAALLGAGWEFGSQVMHLQKLLSGLWASFYANKQQGAAVFNGSPTWVAKIPVLVDVYPQAISLQPLALFAQDQNLNFWHGLANSCAHVITGSASSGGLVPPVLSTAFAGKLLVSEPAL